jgi:hypothetical protein
MDLERPGWSDRNVFVGSGRREGFERLHAVPEVEDHQVIVRTEADV